MQHTQLTHVIGCARRWWRVRWSSCAAKHKRSTPRNPGRHYGIRSDRPRPNPRKVLGLRVSIRQLKRPDDAVATGRAELLVQTTHVHIPFSLQGLGLQGRFSYVKCCSRFSCLSWTGCARRPRRTHARKSAVIANASACHQFLSRPYKL